MIILVINAGSSSVKFTCFDMADDRKVLAGGLIERIGIAGTTMKYTSHKGANFKGGVAVQNAQEAVQLIADKLVSTEYGVLGSLGLVKAIGHRVVHGGEKISNPVILDDYAKGVIRECISIAPLHNPPNLIGIEACEAVFPGVPNVGVFDTAFHATMPSWAYLYGIPYEFYKEHKIRRYGFHGTSHRYVAHEAARLMGAPIGRLKIITCHLGNGASVAAIDGGKCIDTSMGLTPLEGLIMGTRCGDIDPAIVLKIMEIKGLSIKETDNLLNKQSGMLGLADIGSSDMRDLEDKHLAGHNWCTTALEAYGYHVKKYIGAYMAALGGLDVLVFTAGVGENSNHVREMATRGLEGLGIKLDLAKNEPRSSEARFINTEDSPIKIAVIPTNEEQEIATQTLALVQ